MRRAKRRRMWIGAAELALTDYAYGTKSGCGPVRQEMTKAVGRAMDRVGPEEKAIYRLEFVEGMTWQRASDELHIGKSTYYRRRDRLIREIARELEA